MDIPWPIHFGQHDHVDFVADCAYDLNDIVEGPRRIERVDARPQPGRAAISRPGHFDEAFARSGFCVDRDGVFQVAEYDVHLLHKLAHLCAYSFIVRRYEMDHALQTDRHLAQGSRRANGKRRKELAWQSHETIQTTALLRATQGPRQVGQIG